MDDDPFGYRATATPGRRRDTATSTAWSDGYRLVATWAMIDGGPEPVSVTITRDDGGPVGGTAMRQLPLGGMLDASRRAVTFMNEPTLEVTTTAGERVTINVGPQLDWLRSLAEHGNQRGQKLDPDTLEVVAREYATARRYGETPSARVAKLFGISPSQANRRIKAARDAGHITKGGR